ncbi:MAG: ABC-type transport auxiliary lipoprotein family protein [Chthoniobacter sp.]|uniref:PqiC family protein n=1 Tax=Chthoniobacter sp. TaxID=2510640 RepID=UPI0032A9729A
MPLTSFLWRMLALLLCLSAAGCSVLQPHTDPTRFYMLTSRPQAHDTAERGERKRWKVGLRPVDVPAYLRNKAMVVRTQVNEVTFADFDCWAGPLDQGIARTMKDALSSSSNVESVTLDSFGSDTLDYQIAIRILACEGVRAADGSSSIRFSMSWEVRSVAANSAVTKRGVFTAPSAPWDGKDYGQFAERISDAITGAGQALAAALPMKTTQ